MSQPPRLPESPPVDFADPELWRQPGHYCTPFFESGLRSVPIPTTRSLMFFRHEDVIRALTERRLGAMGVRAFEDMGWTEGAFVEWMRRNIVAVDPPAHTRLRNLVNRAFTPRRVEELSEIAEKIAVGLCDEVAEAGEVDFYASFAQRLPLNIICHMLAIPEIDFEQMQRWTEAVNAATGIPRADARRAADEAVRGMMDYIGELVSERRGNLRDDLLSALIAAEEEGEKLSGEELPVMVLQLLVAGHETTRNLIGNGLYSLMVHPEQQQKLRNEPSLLVNAVEEIIRYEPSLIWVARVAQEDLELAGTPVEADQLVLLNLAAANRDPAVHPDPHRFDVTRPNIQVLSFGFGEHYCLGANLARLEGRIAFDSLLSRFSSFEFVGEAPRFAAYTALRTLESFQLRVQPV